MATIPVKAGTTRAQIVKALKSSNQSGPPSFFRPGPSWGNDVVSPRHRLEVTYNVPKGTYALVCFVSDEETGMPHALMGMVKVVVLK